MSEVENATNSVTSMIEDYQKKWTNIAKDNMQLATEFGQALSAAHSPKEWFDVTSEYSKKRFDAYQRHVKELMSPYSG